MHTLLTLAEVAERLRVSRPTVHRLAASGRLPVVRFGRAVRVRPEDLAAMLAASVAAPDPAAAGPRAGLGWAA